MIEGPKVSQGARFRKFALQLLVGGLVGIGFASGMNALIQSGALGALDKSAMIAIVAAVVYLVIGLQVCVGMALPRAGALMLNFEDEAELRDQRRIMMWSAVSMIAMGAMLAVLALSAPDGPIAPAIGLTVAVIASTGLVWASLRILRDMDELLRSVTRECGEIAYYLLLAIGGGWAVLAHLGYSPSMRMLDFITLNYVLLLAASFIASGRRGMLRMR